MLKNSFAEHKKKHKKFTTNLLRLCQKPERFPTAAGCTFGVD